MVKLNLNRNVKININVRDKASGSEHSLDLSKKTLEEGVELCEEFVRQTEGTGNRNEVNWQKSFPQSKFYVAGKPLYVCDIECDDVVATEFKILGVGYLDKHGIWDYKTYTDPEVCKELVTSDVNLVFHYGTGYDKPVIERLLGVGFSATLIDSLYLSYHLFDERSKHGLMSWGEYFGVPKPEIEDFKTATIEQLRERVTEDVKINVKLFEKQWKILKHLYGDNERRIMSLLTYLTFKGECIHHQEEQKVQIDVSGAISLLNELEDLKESKIYELKSILPKVPQYRTVNPPAKPYKSDGSLSVTGTKWQEYLKEEGLPPTHKDPIKIISKYKEPNPNSNDQIKEYLYSIGWKPKVYKESVRKSGQVSKVPQIRIDVDGEKKLCPSIKSLFEKQPSLEVLEGLSVLNHRIGIVKGLLQNIDEKGFISQGVRGFASTLRLRHTKIVNIPSNHKPWGKEIRELFIAGEGYSLVGIDISQLEDQTKRHFIYPYDPEYVKKQMEPGYDAHLAMGVFANSITEEEVSFYKEIKRKEDNEEKISKEDKERFNIIDSKRKEAKVTNFSSTYNIGARKLADSLEIPYAKAKKLLDSFWELNWSVKKFAKDQKVTEVEGKKFILSPMNYFWYPLRDEKDRFSAMNQSGGVFVFDAWVKSLSEKGYWPIAQIHDEIILRVPKGKEEEALRAADKAMEEVNQRLKLNVTIVVDGKSGDNYSEVH